MKIKQSFFPDDLPVTAIYYHNSWLIKLKKKVILELSEKHFFKLHTSPKR